MNPLGVIINFDLLQACAIDRRRSVYFTTHLFICVVPYLGSCVLADAASPAFAVGHRGLGCELMPAFAMCRSWSSHFVLYSDSVALGRASSTNIVNTSHKSELTCINASAIGSPPFANNVASSMFCRMCFSTIRALLTDPTISSLFSSLTTCTRWVFGHCTGFQAGVDFDTH